MTKPLNVSKHALAEHHIALGAACPESGAGYRHRVAQTEPRARRMAVLAACSQVLSSGPMGSMRERLIALTGLGYDLDAQPDSYGDGIVGELEQRVAGLLGKPAAAFFPSGTMAQQAVLRCWAARTGNPVVALHALAHPERHEESALSALSGMRAAHLTAAPRPACTAHFGRPLEEIAALADSVYVSFYKSLGGLSGAAIAGPDDLIAEARIWRHRYGGQIFQQFPAVLAALAGLDAELRRLPSYVLHAAAVAEALGTALAGTVPWFRIHPAVPHTHQFAVFLPFAAEALNGAVIRQASETRVSVFRGWAESDVPDVAKAEVTVTAAALEWTPADVETAARAFISYL
jgi:threonine aldolase